MNDTPASQAEAFLAWWAEVNRLLVAAGWPEMRWGDARAYRDAACSPQQAVDRHITVLAG